MSPDNLLLILLNIVMLSMNVLVITFGFRNSSQLEKLQETAEQQTRLLEFLGRR